MGKVTPPQYTPPAKASSIYEQLRDITVWARWVPERVQILTEEDEEGGAESVNAGSPLEKELLPPQNLVHN